MFGGCSLACVGFRLAETRTLKQMKVLNQLCWNRNDTRQSSPREKSPVVNLREATSCVHFTSRTPLPLSRYTTVGVLCDLSIMLIKMLIELSLSNFFLLDALSVALKESVGAAAELLEELLQWMS